MLVRETTFFSFLQKGDNFSMQHSKREKIECRYGYFENFMSKKKIRKDLNLHTILQIICECIERL